MYVELVNSTLEFRRDTPLLLNCTWSRVLLKGDMVSGLYSKMSVLEQYCIFTVRRNNISQTP